MADWDRVKKEAAKILREFDITKPPIDPEVIARALGVDVGYANFKADIAEKISGFIRFEPLQIIVNKAISPNRKIFTIAHEMGHYLLHRDYARSANYQVLPRKNEYSSEEGKPEEEQEADCFAAELLMPACMVKEYRDYATLSELARIFAVSDKAMLNRLKSLRLS